MVITRWLRRLRARIRHRHFQDDLDRELAFHREMKHADLESGGLAASEARQRAARDLGNVTLAREDARGIWIAPWFQSVWQDVRYALGMLRRQPIFGVSAILVLALGTGLVTAFFTVVNATFLRPWQVSDPASVVMIRARPAGPQLFGGLSIAEYRYLRAHARSLSHVVASLRGGSRITYRAGEEEGFVQSAFVSANYFDALRVGMIAGRGFTAAEEDYGAPRAVAVISESLWREHFDSDPTIIGRVVRIRSQPFVVVGVAARGFSDVQGPTRRDLWMPLPAYALDAGVARHLEQFSDPLQTNVTFLAGRLAPGLSRADAESELSVLSTQFRREAQMPGNGMVVTDTRPISLGAMPRQLPVFALILLALVLVLLLACANVGNLLLARGLSRQRELAIRTSLGASRGRVVRQLVTEAGVLSAAAGVVAIALAYTVPGIVMRVNGGTGQPDFFVPDASVYGFACAASLVTALLCGLAPAFRATRQSVSAVAGDRHGRSGRSGALRATLLSAQIALTTVLLAGAGLLTRAIDHATAIEPGFALRDIDAITIRFPGGAQGPRRQAFFDAFGDALKTTGLPPVALSDVPPLTDISLTAFVHRPDDAPGTIRAFSLRPVSANYFAVLGIPLVAGRLPLDDRSPRELVVSETTARQLWPNEDPIGKPLLSGLGRSAFVTHEIVGVAKDVPVRALGEIEPVIYQGVELFGPTVLMRQAGAGAIEQIRRIAARLDPDVVVTSHPLADNILTSMKNAVIGSRVAWGIGALALALATVGAFGVFAYAVEERRREIGIRMALGARRSQVIRTVLRDNQRSVITGLIVGLGLALGAAPLLRNFLYGLSPFDPIAYAQIAAILLAAAAAATWIPARRATRVDPAITLRCE